MTNFQATQAFALQMDNEDPLRSLRSEFHIPQTASGKDVHYFTGNSLGLMPKRTRTYIEEELNAWQTLGVEGHFKPKNPWFSFHEVVTEPLARVVGALPKEVVAMNSLTTNLHLAMVTFYRPTAQRHKILIEGGAFPSDYYAVKSQIRQHGYAPQDALLELRPRQGEDTLRTEDILQTIEERGSEISCIMIGGLQYLTGQAFDMKAIVDAGHKKGCNVGFDLAHAAGNLELKLHDWNVDFAVWCSYKYLNSGAGGIAGFFVHERHLQRQDLVRCEGWWGTNKKTRFLMQPDFEAMPTVESWQLSNPPIFQLAALRASLELFDQATMAKLHDKSKKLTGFFQFCLDALPGTQIETITPRQEQQRGCQLSLRISSKGGKDYIHSLGERGFVCDFREPNIVRAAPAPLYNTFTDVFALAAVLKQGV